MLHSWFFVPLAAALSLGANSCALLGPGCDSKNENSADGTHFGGGNAFDYDAASPEYDSGNGGGNGDGGGPACVANIAGSFSVQSPLRLPDGDVTFDTIDTSLVMLGAGGCLRQLDLSLSLAGDFNCSLDITAGPYKDAQGGLIVSRLTFQGDGPCPGWPAAARKGLSFVIEETPTALSANQPYGTLAFSGDQCSPEDSIGLAQTCFDGTLDLALQGRYLDSAFSFFDDDAGADAWLDLEGATLRVHGNFCGFAFGAQCPSTLEL